MLLLEGFAVGALGNTWAAANGLPRDDELAEMLQKPSELRVPGGVGNAAMQREVLADRVLAPLRGEIDIIEAAQEAADSAGFNARSAASPAASISMPVRSSITSSTSRRGDIQSNSIRRDRRAFSGTKAPTPWRVTTRPSARNAATASRTTVRLTPVAAINSCSVGKREPGAILPLVMFSASRVTSSPVNERGTQSARAVAQAGVRSPHGRPFRQAIII